MPSLSRVVVAALASTVFACSSSGPTSSAGENGWTAAYIASSAGTLRSLSLRPDGTYASWERSCAGGQSGGAPTCLHLGTYSFDASHTRLTLTDAASGAVRTVPFTPGVSSGTSGPTSLAVAGLVQGAGTSLVTSDAPPSTATIGDQGMNLEQGGGATLASDDPASCAMTFALAHPQRLQAQATARFANLGGDWTGTPAAGTFDVPGPFKKMSGIYQRSGAADPSLNVQLDPAALGKSQTCNAAFQALAALFEEAPGDDGQDYVGGTMNALADLVGNFWSGGDGGNIRPTNHGYVDAATASDSGAPSSVIDAVSGWQAGDALPGMWDHTTMYNALYWAWKTTGDPSFLTKMQSDWSYLKSRYPNVADLENCRNDSVIVASDDAAWEAMFYMQAYEATGDSLAKDIAKQVIICTNDFFMGPNNSQYGLLYDTNDSTHPLRTSTTEIGLAIAALQIYQAEGDPNWLLTAKNSYARMHQYLQFPTGAYFCEFSVNPSDGAGYLQPVGYDRTDDVHVGDSIAYIGGSMGMAVLGARLASVTGDADYAANAVQAASSLLATFLEGGLFMNDRDAWTDGAYAAAFASDVMFLDGIDPELRTVFRATAGSVLANDRTGDGYYGGDWDGGDVWLGIGHDPTYIGMALPQQVYTSTSAVAYVIAAGFLQANGW